ncbi:glycosyltransferase family 2 protein [Winogradskyella sp.]|uniref:glycosyltransferase family 2 protein n=1 Tax=Winogradskyella sp. TaxID=1883156 RepID=UPI002637510A|nr:glycosyltransferase family 2 protein [Winogradskyella sp.]
MKELTIITVNYNNASGLRDTIISVKNQNIDTIEHVVIDGASSDGSISILEEYTSHVKYKTEPDSGVYEAMNKGIKLAEGKFLLFLNSGDVLHDDNVLTNVLPKLKSEYAICYGNLVFKSESDRFVQKYPERLSFSFFLKESLPHPATFIQKSLFDTLFFYSETFKIVSDWEFFICAICKENVAYKYLDETISIFGLDGMSNHPSNKKVIEAERKQVLQKHFPAFIEDYSDINLLETNRFKALRALENTAVGRKLNSIWLRLMLLVYKGKTPEQLK